MNKVLLSVFAVLFLATTALAHSGRTNACGGHNDRKRGGYHVHNLAKHCACNPNDIECKPQEKKSEKKKIK